MCTLSLFRTDQGYRVFMNRDERHDRPAENPPQILCETHAVFGPIDPVSQGSWIAYNARGYWGCLLNGYFEEEGHDGAGYKSRGGVLLEILSQEDPLFYMQNLECEGYPSFRLVIGSAAQHQLFVWDGAHYRAEDFHGFYKDEAYFLSSSSWQQEAVIEARKALFFDWFAQGRPMKNNVPAFHYTQEPAPESAPMMHRSYSRTQSITALMVSPAGVEMHYERIAPVSMAVPNAAE